MCPHTYLYIRIYHVHIHICTYLRIYIHVHIYTYAYIYTYTYTHTYIHIHTHTYTHMHIYTYIYTYTHVHTHIYKHIRGARWDCSTHVWASERGADSGGCGPLMGRSPQERAARYIFFSNYQPTEWAGKFFEEFECCRLRVGQFRRKRAKSPLGATQNGDVKKFEDDVRQG